MIFLGGALLTSSTGEGLLERGVLVTLLAEELKPSSGDGPDDRVGPPEALAASAAPDVAAESRVLEVFKSLIWLSSIEGGRDLCIGL